MEIYLAIISFTFVASITPGPNNLMLASSAMNFGVFRTLPHLLGVPLGVSLILVFCSVGLGTLILNIPALQTVLAAVASAYLLYLLWSINRSASAQTQTSGKPLTLWQSASFQLINPKAWVLITGLSTIIFSRPSEHHFLQLPLYCLAFSAMNILCIGTWTLLGAAMQKGWNQPRIRQLYLCAIAILTAYCIYGLWR